MPGRIAIDFGTSNTVVANWDTVRQVGISYPMGEYGRFVKMSDELVSVVPSLIHHRRVCFWR